MSEVSTNQNQTVSVGEWIIAYILMGLPLIGIIMTFIWAFGTDAKPSKKNWARAMLVIWVIVIIFSIIIGVVAGAAILALVEDGGLSFSS
jgi:hypothetical protein